MIWRTTILALLIASVAMAGDTKWTYSRLVDAPLAPIDKPVQVKILKVSAERGPAADGDIDMDLVPIPTDASKTSKVVKASGEAPHKLTPDVTVDPLSQASPQSYRVFVGGEVVRPGSFNAQRPFTALQAVIAAGGLKEGGKPTEIVVLRYVKKDADPTAKRVDLSASLAGKGTTDLWLETHDVVIVPKAGAPTSTEEIIRGLPIPVATAAKNRLVEIQRIKTDPESAKKASLLPVR